MSISIKLNTLHKSKALQPTVKIFLKELGNRRSIPLSNSNSRRKVKMGGLGPRTTLKLSPGSIKIIPHSPPPSPWLSLKLADHFEGWETINQQRAFYDERDCLGPSHNLTSEKLKNRKEDDVVIFDYSLDPDYLKSANWYLPVEEGGPPSGRFAQDDDLIFRVSKDNLLKSKQFDQIINPAKEPRLLESRGPRLGVM